MPEVTALANSKGGIGKTTSTVQLAHEKAKTGKRVLIIDLDGQKSLTKALGLEASPGETTVFACLTDPSKGLERAVKHFSGTPSYPVHYPSSGCIDVIPGARDITKAANAFDRVRANQPVPSYELVLVYLINTFAQQYHEVFLDMSPSTDRTTVAAFFAAHKTVAPVAAEPMAIDGVQEFLQTLTENNVARAGFNLQGQTKLAGLLLAKVMPDQMKVVQKFQQILTQSNIPHFGETFIPYTTAGWESTGERVPIDVYQSGDAASLAYRNVAAQL